MFIQQASKQSFPAYQKHRGFFFSTKLVLALQTFKLLILRSSVLSTKPAHVSTSYEPKRFN